MSYRKPACIETVTTAAFTHSSASLAVIATQDINVSAGDSLLVTVTAKILLTDSSTNGTANFRLEVDGTPYHSIDIMALPVDNVPSQFNFAGPLAMSRLVTGLSAGSHTIRVRCSWGGTSGGSNGISIDIPASQLRPFAMQIVRFP